MAWTDRFFRQMGDTVIVNGFEGFMVYLLLRDHRLVRRCIINPALVGIVSNILTSVLLGPSTIGTLLSLLVTLDLCLIFFVIGAKERWIDLLVNGKITKAPNWDTWKKWRNK